MEQFTNVGAADKPLLAMFAEVIMSIRFFNRRSVKMLLRTKNVKRYSAEKYAVICTGT